MLFNTFFTTLNKTNIPYAITGRTEKYPEVIHSDIDIIIPSNSFYAFWKFMNELSEIGICWIQVISHETDAHYCVISLSDGINHRILKPDVCSDFYRKAILLIKSDFLLNNRMFNPKGFYQLAPEKEFIYYLLKKIDKGSINPEQFKHIREQWLQNPTECLKLASSYFNDSNILLIENILINNEFLLFVSKINDLKTYLHENLKFNLKDLLYKINNRVKRILQPTGLVVAFMGPDGSGKTTIIEGVKADITEVFRQNKQFHLYPKYSKSIVPTIAPHSQKPRAFLGSVFKLFYFLCLYFFGYWTKIYPLKIKSTFIVFDRYYHDILVDSLRYRNGAGKFLTKFVGFLIHKPDIWILLDAPAEVIQNRKKEVTFEETSRQVKAYQQLFCELDNAFVINANQTPDRVIYDTEKVIIEFLKERTSKRYKNY